MWERGCFLSRAPQNALAASSLGGAFAWGWESLLLLPCSWNAPPRSPLPPSLLDRFVSGLSFNVSFTFNRQPLRVQHRALELTDRCPLEPVLFPMAARGVAQLPSDVTFK